MVAGVSMRAERNLCRAGLIALLHWHRMDVAKLENLICLASDKEGHMLHRVSKNVQYMCTVGIHKSNQALTMTVNAGEPLHTSHGYQSLISSFKTFCDDSNHRL